MSREPHAWPTFKPSRQKSGLASLGIEWTVWGMGERAQVENQDTFPEFGLALP